MPYKTGCAWWKPPGFSKDLGKKKTRRSKRASAGKVAADYQFRFHFTLVFFFVPGVSRLRAGPESEPGKEPYLIAGTLIAARGARAAAISSPWVDSWTWGIESVFER